MIFVQCMLLQVTAHFILEFPTVSQKAASLRYFNGRNTAVEMATHQWLGSTLFLL